jgi:hypothetical protein
MAKPLSISSLTRIQTQIVNEFKLEALVWEDSEGGDDDGGNQDTEESLERELLSLEEEGDASVINKQLFYSLVMLAGVIN